MDQDITPGDRAQAVTWETLEEFVREKVQGFVQGVLEEEVTELLGRGKSERRGGGRGCWVSQWSREAASVDAGEWNDHGAAPSGA